MNLVNRGFIFVKARPVFIKWAQTIDPDLLIDEQAEGSVYLIEEEFWDDDVILKKYGKQIAQQEFESLGFEIADWPESFELDDFLSWFSCELGCTCIDLLKEPLQKEAL